MIDIDGTIFYKIGITAALESRISGFIRENGNELLWSKEDLLYNCFLAEQKIIEENKKFFYRPKKIINGGITECLSIEIKG